jgi:transposase
MLRKKNYGYFALMSNSIKNPVEALKIYRTKDLIEKTFGNLKERLSEIQQSLFKFYQVFDGQSST